MNIIHLFKLPMNFIHWGRNFINKIFNYFFLKKFLVQYGKNLIINGRVNLNINGKFIVGQNCIITSGKKYNQVGYNEKTIITINKGAVVCFGDNVGVSNINLYSKKEISIGNNVLIGGGTNIWDTDFHSLDTENRIFEGDTNVKSASIIIEDDVFIGANVTILKGVRIGKGSIVGAVSLVSKSIPSGEIWAGNPAKFMKKII